MDGRVEGSITVWVGHLKAGDHEAAHHLWAPYYDRMVRLARRKLRSSAAAGRAVEDEEDAALSGVPIATEKKPTIFRASRSRKRS